MLNKVSCRFSGQKALHTTRLALHLYEHFYVPVPNAPIPTESKPVSVFRCGMSSVAVFIVNDANVTGGIAMLQSTSLKTTVKVSQTISC